LIPQDLSIWYGKESEARLDTLRVDGMLRFAPKQDTKMLVDTFVVSPDGKLKIRSADRPIQADKTTQIIFTSDTAIAQVIQDDQTRQGKQTFSIDIKNIEGITKAYAQNKIKLNVWGVNGEFKQKLGSTKVGLLNHRTDS
jgi:hypothetical protein